MRIYDGRPRQDYEEVFRSLGAFIDLRGMRSILILEAPDGFVVQARLALPGRSRMQIVQVNTVVAGKVASIEEYIASETPPR